MAITGVSSSVSMLQAAQSAAQGARAGLTPPVADPAAPSFANRLGQAIENVNAQQAKASEAVRDFETGRTDDLAAVMVEQQISSLGFQMTMQVRNKALQAYRDIMNMPV